MTYKELYEKAASMLYRGEITLGDFNKMVKPLDVEIHHEPHWIPVTEKLPETYDEVLTTYIVNGNRKKRYVETSRYYHDGYSGYWSSPWDKYRIAGTRIEVIAWMPLPDPYKRVTE